MKLKDYKEKVIVFLKNRKWKFGAAVLIIVLIASIILYVLFRTANGYNYISALANIVIAISAVMAYLTARNYLPQLTTQEGYKIAIKMVNNELQSTSIINDAIVAAKNTDVLFKKLDNKIATVVDNEKIEKAIINFNKIIASAEEYERSIHRYISTMNTYGLEPAPDRKVYFDGFCQSLNQISSVLNEIKIILPSFKNYHKSIISDSYERVHTPFQYDYSKERYKKINDALSSLDSANKSLNSHRLSFFGEKKQIGKLFVVNLD